jgi:hypothetical protein
VSRAVRRRRGRACARWRGATRHARRTPRDRGDRPNARRPARLPGRTTPSPEPGHGWSSPVEQKVLRLRAGARGAAQRLLPPSDTGDLQSRMAASCSAFRRAYRSNMSSIVRADGSIVEVAPERCPAGHELAPGRTLVGWSPCDCTAGVSGHRTYTCQALVDGRECGLVLSYPPCQDPSAGPMLWDYGGPVAKVP